MQIYTKSAQTENGTRPHSSIAISPESDQVLLIIFDCKLWQPITFLWIDIKSLIVPLIKSLSHIFVESTAQWHGSTFWGTVFHLKMTPFCFINVPKKRVFSKSLYQLRRNQACPTISFTFLKVPHRASGLKANIWHDFQRPSYYLEIFCALKRKHDSKSI